MRTRIVVFFVSLCFLLLGGGHYLHAAGTYNNHIPNSPTQLLTKNQQVKLTRTDQGSTIIEDADLDLDEEYHSGNNLKDPGTNKLFATKDSLLNGWYLRLSHLFIANHYYKCFKNFPPFCGNSSPIYITQRVLRI